MYLAEQLYGTLFLGKNNPILSSAFQQCLLLPGRLRFSRSCANLQGRVVHGEGGAGRCCPKAGAPTYAVWFLGHSGVLQLWMGHNLVGMVSKHAFRMQED